MEKDSIRAEVLAILSRFAPEVDLASVKPDQALRDQFEIDSLDFVNFMVRLHQGFRIEIPEADYGEFRTLDRAVEYIKKKRAS
jgi:acyl carrier protein